MLFCYDRYLNSLCVSASPVLCFCVLCVCTCCSTFQKYNCTQQPFLLRKDEYLTDNGDQHSCIYALAAFAGKLMPRCKTDLYVYIQLSVHNVSSINVTLIL